MVDLKQLFASFKVQLSILDCHGWWNFVAKGRYINWYSFLTWIKSFWGIFSSQELYKKNVVDKMNFPDWYKAML